MPERIPLIKSTRELSVGKPVIYGAAGILGLYLLSKYLQASRENRILNGIQQLAQSNAAIASGLGQNKINDEPRITNYPEF